MQRQNALHLQALPLIFSVQHIPQENSMDINKCTSTMRGTHQWKNESEIAPRRK